MARSRTPEPSEAPPVALPPHTRTVGQLVAETVRLYGQRFWRALPLGLVVAAADQASFGLSVGGRVAVLLAAAPLFSAAYAAACSLVSGERLARRTAVRAVLLGTIVFLPAAVLLPWFALAGIVWLALLGNAVPAVALEGRSAPAALRRAIEVARADLVHALGGLATLAVLFGLLRLALGFLLRSQADNTVRVSLFLADVVLAPILFLGAALLFLDLRARVGRSSRARGRRSA